MKLTGFYEIKLNKQLVWEALNNPEILRKVIPGCEEFTKNSDTEFIAKATNKIGPFNASFTGDIELKDLNPPDSYKIVGQGNSPVGFATGEANVKLALNGPTLLVTFAENSVSEFFINSLHPGIAFSNTSGSFNASQTFCFSKLIW